MEIAVRNWNHFGSGEVRITRESTEITIPVNSWHDRYALAATLRKAASEIDGTDEDPQP